MCVCVCKCVCKWVCNKKARVCYEWNEYILNVKTLCCTCFTSWPPLLTDLTEINFVLLKGEECHRCSTPILPRTSSSPQSHTPLPPPSRPPHHPSREERNNFNGKRKYNWDLLQDPILPNLFSSLMNNLSVFC